MANPQKENGSTDIANELLQKIYSSNFNSTQLDIIFCVIRFTYGFHRKTHDLSISFISKATNKNRITISKEIVKLIDNNVLIQDKKPTYSQPRKIGINKNYELWTVAYNETVDKNETVSQMANTTVVLSETPTVVLSETKKLKSKKLKNKLKQNSVSVYFKVCDYFNNVAVADGHYFKNKKTFRTEADDKCLIEGVDRLLKKYTLTDINDVIYQAYNNHVEHEWITNNKKSSIEFYSYKTIFKEDKFIKYLEEYRRKK